MLSDNEIYMALQHINFGRNWLYQAQLKSLDVSHRVLQHIEEELGI